MAVEHAMFKFEDLKVNSHDDRQTHRMMKEEKQENWSNQAF